MTPEIGITGTPVIDPASGPHGTIYMIAMSKDGSGNYHQRLHALDLTTGAEEFSGPMEVSGSASGSGAEDTFLPAQHKERAGLLLLNGVVYTSWGSHCDAGPYTGWVFGYNETTLAKVTTINLTPNGNDGGIWNSGAGPAADATGNIFLLTGNGTFDTTLTNGFPSKGDYGNAFVKMSSSGGLTVTDYFTMDNTTSESNGDVDLGSGGLMLLPSLPGKAGSPVSLAVGAGKDSNLYVVDQTNLGKFSSSSDTIYQQLSGVLPGGVWSSPAWFNGTLYYGSQGSTLKAFTFSNTTGLFPVVPTSQSPTSFGYPGATPSVSANGTSNGIVWAAENSSPAVLHAYDATNVSHELYNSNQASGSRDQFGSGNKYIVPTVANGKVYVGTTNGVGVFGLLSIALPPAVLTLPANGSTGQPLSATLNWNTASGAASYDVYFGASSTPPFVTNVAETTYTPGTLSANTLYYWKIVAKNASGSTPSAVWSFTTATVGGGPGTPVLTLPANGSTGQSLNPTLNWSAASGATSYDVYMGTSSTPPFAINVTGTTYAPGTLSVNTLYYWNIVAKNGGGSTASSTWSFTTQATQPPELIWMSTFTRQAVSWSESGAGGNVETGYSWLSQAGVPGWTLAATGDFNGDGIPDLIWQNDTTRQAVIWYMGGTNGTQEQSWAWLNNSNPVPGWRIVAAADFNRDGVPDVVWLNDTTRQAVIWYMGGVSGSIEQSWSWVSSAGVFGWTIRAAGDFNHDGIPDIVWEQDNTRQALIWYMSGADGSQHSTYDWISQTGVPGWTVAGVGDFNGDGSLDVVWLNDTTQQAVVWYMSGADGTTYLSYNWLSQTGVYGWKLLVRH